MIRHHFSIIKLLSVAATTISTLHTENFPRGGDSSVGRASDRKARRNTDTVSTTQCDKGFFFFSESTSSADSVTVSVQPSCAIAYVNNCAHVKSPEEWQPYNTSVWTQENTTRSDRNGYSSVLADVVLYPGKAIRMSHKGQRRFGGSSTDYGQSDSNLLHI